MNRLTKATVVCVAALLAGAPGRLEALVVMSESFRNAAATGWTLLGNATLTSGAPDVSGSGWLRLTSASTDQAGSAIYGTSFSSSDGAQITFSYATYGGTGADGISFYLIDGSTATPTVGAPGGGLGYSRTTSPSVRDGVTGGYLGVGLDEYGNFASTAVGDCNPSCPGLSPNYVTVRGSGNLSTGFNYLTQQPLTIGTASRAGAKRVRITVSPGPTVTITVAVDSGSGFVNVISNFNVSGATSQGALPATFKMGLSASTGGSTNYHEIRDLNLNGARASNTALVSSVNPSTAGQTVTFTATVTGASGTPTGTVTFMDGTTSLGTGTLNGAGVATLDTSTLTVGPHSVTATFAGDGIYASSLSTAVSQSVSNAAPTAWSMNPTAGPVAGGTSVTISGTGFVTGATVAFGAKTATVTSLSPTSITVTAPSAASASTVTVKVTNPDTQSVSLSQGYSYNPGGCWPETGGSNSRMVSPCHPAVAGDPRDPNATPIALGSPDPNTVTVPPLWQSSNPADSTIVFFQGAPPSPKATGPGASAPSPAVPSGSDGAYRRNAATGSFDLVLFQGISGAKTGGGASTLTASAPAFVTTSYSNGTLVWATTLKYASSKGNGVWDRLQKVGGVEFDLPIVTLDVNGDGKADYASLPWGAIGPLLGGFIGGGGPPTQTPQIWMPLADTDGDGFGDAVVFDPTGSGHPSSFIPKSPAILPPVDERGLVDVPALGEWGLFALALSLGAAGWLALRRTIG